MVATVNASTSAGVVITPDNSGVLAFQSSSATALTIDASQNSTFVGTASATKLIPTGSSATGNGLYLPAANSLGLSTNGTNAVYIDSSQNILIGTTSATFTYTGSSTATAKQVISTSGYDCLNLISTAANPGIDFSQPNNASTIYRYANITGVMTTTTAGSESGALTFATGNSGANTAERMRIRSDGALLVGTTIEPTSVYNGFKTDVSYTIISAASATCLYVNRNTTTGEVVQIRYNNGGVGSISTNGSTTTYGTSSDYRLKENIAPMTGALTKVAQLKPVTYKWKSTGEESQGFIAHELAEVVPDCVTGEKDETEVVNIKDEEGNVIRQETKPKYQNVDTSFLVATLTAAIQELKAINDTLTARIVALENR